MLKNIGAVIAGLSRCRASVGTDMLVGIQWRFSVTTSTGMLAFATRLSDYLYRVRRVSYCMARQGKNDHSMGACRYRTTGCIAGVVFGWNLSSHWYPLLIAITAIPQRDFGRLASN